LRLVKKVLKILEDKKPDIFSMSWIIRNGGNIMERVALYSENDIEKVVVELPEKWQKRWNANADGFNFRELSRDLVKVFEEKEPSYITDRWIRKTACSLYMKIVRSVRKNDNPDWERVVADWPEEWQNLWMGSDFCFQELIDNLVDFFEEINPSYITRGWIKHYANSCYIMIVENVRKNDNPDWERVVAAWPKKWRRLWVEGDYSRKFLPRIWAMTQGKYSDKEELQNILAENKEYLYTLIESRSKEEKLVRDRIIISLIKLVHKGNADAMDYLVSSLELNCVNWIIYLDGMSIYETFYQDVINIIKRCVRNYSFEKSFMTYLFVALKKGMASLPNFISIRLDKDRYGDGKKRSNHEMIAIEDYSDE